MGYRDAMELCETFIAGHPDRAVTARELADMTGYSLYHFCHVFRAYYDMPVGEYVRRQALSRAASEILAGKSVTEASLNAGFDTPAGFSKAFRKQFGMSATEYRRQNLKKQNLKRRDKIMEPVIEKKEAFIATGYYILPKDDQVDILESGAYWFGVDFTGHPKYPVDSSVMGEIGAWTHPDEIAGGLKYFFGYISDGGKAPDGFVKVDIPAADYAVFDVPPAASRDDGGEELAQNIRKIWKYIFKEWLDQSAYLFDESKMCFEFYHGGDTKVYIPVKAKN